MPNRASAIEITDINTKGIHFWARKDVIFAQLDAEMAELRKIGGIVTKEGSVGIGRAEITPGGQIVRGKWKWKYQKKGDASVGDDPHLNDGTARREQESNWWMMVNLNKRTKGDANAKLMVGAMSYALTMIKNTPLYWGPNLSSSIFIWGPKVSSVSEEARAQYQRDRSQPARYIKSLEVRAPKAEVGAVKERLHCHFQLYVTHYSMIHLDTKAFGRIFAMFYNKYLAQNGVKDQSDPDSLRIANGKKVLVWARLSPQKNAHEWMHRYAAKSQDD